MMYKNVAIIGSNGFIGSHLTHKLQQVEGINLFLFGKKNISVFGDSFPYSVIDLTNKTQIAESFSNIDLVYYLASESIPASSWDTPELEVEKNLLPFLKFLDAISALKVKKIAFISSGGTIYGPTTESAKEDSNKNPFSPHGITKLTMEYFLNYFKVKNGLNFHVYRVSNVYGEGQNTKKGIGIINTFLEKILSHNEINIFGSGNNIRNYIYVKDLAEILSFALYSNPESSDVFNLSSNDTLSINDMVEVIKSVVTENFKTIYNPQRQSDNSAIYLDNTKLVKAYPEFKFTPLAEGIQHTYNFIKGIHP